MTLGDETVAFDLQPVAADVPDTFWLVPRAPLTEGRGYTLSLDGAPSISVTVSGAADTTPPAPPVVNAASFRDGDWCTDLVGATPAIPTPAEPYLTADVELLRGGVVIAHRIGTGLFVTADDPACFGRFHLDGLVEGEELTARVRVFDLAGNASEQVSVPLTARFARAGVRSPCGRWCSAGVPRRGDGFFPAGLLVALVALGVLGSRGRRGRAAPRA